MYPTIKKLEVYGQFRYLWMKYVQGFNLANHCAGCLVGEYEPNVSVNLMRLDDFKLNRYPANYFYLCGVSKPYKWENNFHLAFRYKEGSTISVKNNGIFIEIENAEQIIIQNLGVDMYSKLTQYGHKKEFRTCRNWQFAFQQTYNQ